MSKIFGYKQVEREDWYSIPDAYSDREIELVRDPEGGTVTTLPTAIPSPFARMDLVKTAFQNISRTPELKAYKQDRNVVASQYDEKLVSYCLDLAEILFNYDSLRDHIQIIVWDRDTDLQNNNNQDEGHRRFLDTLKLYLEQDAAAYNFGLLNRLYLIQYDYAIIGCTSPVTLFFTTANEDKLPRIRLTNNHETFSNNYKPLYKRDQEFQKYLHLLFASNTILAERLQSVYAYLRKSLERTREKQEIQRLINNQPQENLNRYPELDTGVAGNVVEVLGVPLRKRHVEDMVAAVQKSDFMICATKSIPDPKPLVLQNNFNRDFKYINGNWDRNTQVPYLDPQPLDQRTLPNSQVRYPYLTVSDFLEPYLIRLVYPINRDKFFNGNLKVEVGNNNKHYLLPLKKEFFNYFKSDDLVNGGNDLPKIEMVQRAGGSVKVTLRIPVKRNNEYITFERIYYDGRQPDEFRNEGAVIELQFGVTIFPFIKLNDPTLRPFYRVQLIDRNITGNLMNTRCELRFFSNENQREVESTCRNRSRKPDASSHYYVLDQEFDYIQFQNSFASGVSGIIIPKWRTYQSGNKIFHFAVDFGTTNTHIEYKVGNNVSQPFNITDADMQVATLFHPTETSEDFGGTGAIAIGELIDYEFVPQRIGDDAEYKFPQRTVIAVSNQLNINDQNNTVLADFNIPFVYEKKPERDKIHSNLKWSEMNPESKQIIKAYFEEIMMLLRNKVLLNGGNLAETRLVWFYPSSMTLGRLAYLEELWANLFHHYFGANNPHIYSISESLAPFYYYERTGRIQGGAATPAVSIDIGGGTTDVVIFQGNAPRYLTSFEFAANAIFGDAYGRRLGENHGLVRKYLPQYQTLLTENRLEELNQVVRSIIRTNKSDDINSFLFSIERHPRVNNRDLFSYNKKLSQDEDFKIVFLYFYTAIVYHIAELMKHKGVAFPTEFIFSGNGSRILNIITPSLRLLGNLSKKIFEHVYGQKYPYNELRITIEREIPKEVTCKGGLMVENNQLNVNLEEIKTVFTCLNGVERISYRDLNQERKDEIILYVRRFNEFFLKLAQEFNFRNNFNVSPRSMDAFREHIKNESIPDNLDRGLEYNRQVNRAADDDEISETLFFFPLTGSISNLLQRLANPNN